MMVLDIDLRDRLHLVLLDIDHFFGLLNQLLRDLLLVVEDLGLSVKIVDYCL